MHEETIQNLMKTANSYMEIIKREFDLYSNKNFNKTIIIETNGSILPINKDDSIIMPKSAYIMLNEMKKLPGFGYNKLHKTSDSENNNFLDYIKHIYIAGLTPEEYFQELLLHEVINSCSFEETSALKKGVVELKTRELAKKYNLITSRCLYSKEMEVAKKFQDLIGEELMNKIVMAKSRRELYLNLGEELYSVYYSVSDQMQGQYDKYANKQINEKGVIIKKAIEYSKINYDGAKISIDCYETYCSREAGFKKMA